MWRYGNQFYDTQNLPHCRKQANVVVPWLRVEKCNVEDNIPSTNL